MDTDIYRVVNKNGSSLSHQEVCRDCAKQFQDKGFEVEFDKHLYKFTEVKNGKCFYENEEINCSCCQHELVSEKEPLLNTI